MVSKGVYTGGFAASSSQDNNELPNGEKNWTYDIIYTSNNQFATLMATRLYTPQILFVRQAYADLQSYISGWYSVALTQV